MKCRLDAPLCRTCYGPITDFDTGCAVLLLDARGASGLARKNAPLDE
jgi:hypothetical protein